MTEQMNRNFTLVTLLVTGLLIAFVVQCLALYRMHDKLTQMAPTPATSSPDATLPAPIEAAPTPAPAPASFPPASATPTPPGASPLDTIDQPPVVAPPLQTRTPARHQPQNLPHAANQPDVPDYDLVSWGLDRWDPFAEMLRMQDRINQMFLTAFNRFQNSDDFGGLSRDYPFSPNLNIEDKGDHYLVTVDLPGADNSQINVKYEAPLLILSGSVQSETTEQDGSRILRQERRRGQIPAGRVAARPHPSGPDHHPERERSHDHNRS